MQLSKEEYARKRIHNGSSVQIDKCVAGETVRHHSASLVMSNSYPRDGIFNQHLTTIKDSYILLPKDTSYSFAGLVGRESKHPLTISGVLISKDWKYYSKLKGQNIKTSAIFGKPKRPQIDILDKKSLCYPKQIYMQTCQFQLILLKNDIGSKICWISMS